MPAELDQYETVWDIEPLALDTPSWGLPNYLRRYPLNGKMFEITRSSGGSITVTWCDSDLANGDIIQYDTGTGKMVLRGNNSDNDPSTNFDIDHEIERLKFEYYKNIVVSFPYRAKYGTHGGSFDSRQGAVNLLAIRGWREGRPVADVRNEWDDTIIALWEDNGGRKRCREFRGTTQPGLHEDNRKAQHQAKGILGEEYGPKGNAIMLPGQYLYRRGKHKDRLGLAQVGYYDKGYTQRHEEIEIIQDPLPAGIIVAKGFARFSTKKELISIEIVDAGSGYNTANPVSINFLQGADSLGSGATIELIGTSGSISLDTFTSSSSNELKITNGGSNYQFCCTAKDSKVEDRCKFSMPLPGIPSNQTPFHPEGAFCAQIDPAFGIQNIAPEIKSGLHLVENKTGGVNGEVQINMVSSAGKYVFNATVKSNAAGSGYKVGELFSCQVTSTYRCSVQILGVDNSGSITNVCINQPREYDTNVLSTSSYDVSLNASNSVPNIVAWVYIDMSDNQNPKLRDIILVRRNEFVTWDVCDQISFQFHDTSSPIFKVLLVGNRGCGKAKFVRYPHNSEPDKWWKNNVYGIPYNVDQDYMRSLRLNHGIEYATIHANIHSGKSLQVKNWSQGCQVLHVGSSSTGSVTSDSVGLKLFMEAFDNHPGLQNRQSSGSANFSRYGRPNPSGSGDTVYYTLVTGSMVSDLVGENEYDYPRKGPFGVSYNGVQGKRLFNHIIKTYERFEEDDFDQSNVADFRCYGDNSAENLRYSLSNKYIDAAHILLKAIFSFTKLFGQECPLDTTNLRTKETKHSNGPTIQDLIDLTLMKDYYFDKSQETRRLIVELSSSLDFTTGVYSLEKGTGSDKTTANILHSFPYHTDDGSGNIVYRYCLFISDSTISGSSNEFEEGESISITGSANATGDILDYGINSKIPIEGRAQNKSIVHALVNAGWGVEIDVDDIARGDLFVQWNEHTEKVRMGVVTMAQSSSKRLNEKKRFEYIRWGKSGLIDSYNSSRAYTHSNKKTCYFVRLKDVNLIRDIFQSIN